jgi:hypothetical protein
MADQEYMLTTVDNPFNPFDDFTNWYNYDTQKGHHTLAFLARIAHTSTDLSDEDQRLIVQQAIDEIVRENVSGIMRKVSRSGEPVTKEAEI